MSRDKKKLLSKEERREQIIQASIQVFAAKGYFQAQISDIIEKADIARGTFYLYFKGKREIFDEIISIIFKRLRAEVKGLPREAVDQIPIELYRNLKRVCQLFLKESWMIRILFSETSGLDPDLDQKLKQFYDQTLDIIRRGLQQGCDMGFVRKANFDILSISLLGGLKELFYQSDLKIIQADLSLFVDELYSFIVHAVVKPELASELEVFLKVKDEI